MNTVLITGGSTGLGLALSHHFAQHGYVICWVSHLEEDLQRGKDTIQQAFPNAEIHFLVQDLSVPEGPKKTYDWVQNNGWTIDVLVNNAGFGTYGFADTIPLDREVQLIQLNVLGVFKLTRLFLTNMLKRDAGTIINISSSSALQPVPKLATYAASKAFVKHYSEGIADELEQLKSNVRVMVVCPAAFGDSPFRFSAKMENVRTYEGLVATTKDEVAKDIWNGFQRGQTLVISGAKMRWSMWLVKVLPRFIMQRLVRWEIDEKR